MWKKVFLVFIALFIAAQFIRTPKNEGLPMMGNDLFQLHSAPVAVRSAIQNSCYDCHSNHTRYPWYAEIQPVSWWLGQHVTEGKEHLNFSEFGHLEPRRAARKLEDSIEQIEDDAMPLPSYLWQHRSARLTDDQKKAVNEWLENLELSLRPEGEKAE
ncbi:MAG TPA: heme-binding domain-containing protein [Opitutaceae bacterium]|nr:heme-binding domain-containing protein [Opitutaceae bacterium]